MPQDDTPDLIRTYAPRSQEQMKNASLNQVLNRA